MQKYQQVWNLKYKIIASTFNNAYSMVKFQNVPNNQQHQQN